MKSSLEYFIDRIWPYLPQHTRICLTHKFERFREKASIPLPKPETRVFCVSEDIKRRFGSASPIMSGDLGYSLVCTCKDEVGNVDTLIDSIGNQTLLPQEVIVCDAGSTDGTFEKLEQWKREENRFSVQILREEGANIARGRNIATGFASKDYILFADLGTTLDRNWSRYLCSAFFDPEIDFVMGFYKPVFSEWWHEPLAFFLLPRWEFLNPETFFASARSLAIKRDLFKEVGGFPEFLSHAGEDSLFNYNVKNKVKVVAFVPEAISYWHMESRPLKMWISIYRYALGDAETGLLFWNYYRELIIKESKCVFDFLVFLVLFFFAKVLDLVFISEFLSLISYVFLIMGVFKVYKLALEYSVFLNVGLTEAIKRFVVLLFFISAQTTGFVGGLVKGKV